MSRVWTGSIRGTQWSVIAVFLFIFLWTDAPSLRKDIEQYNHSYHAVKNHPQSSHSLSKTKLAHLRRDSLNALKKTRDTVEEFWTDLSWGDEKSFTLMSNIAISLVGLLALFLLQKAPSVINVIRLRMAENEQRAKREQIIQYTDSGISVAEPGSNRVQSTLSTVGTPLLCLMGLFAGLFTYLANFDSIVFTCIGLLQYSLLGQTKSIVPLMVFAIPFALNGAVAQFQLRRRDDSINQQKVLMYNGKDVAELRKSNEKIREGIIQGSISKTERQNLRRGDIVLVKSGSILPADCTPLTTIVTSAPISINKKDQGKLDTIDSSDFTIFTDEKGLTGEDRTQHKKYINLSNGTQLIVPVTNDSYSIPNPLGRETKDQDYVCFQDTSLFVDKLPENHIGYVLLLVLRIGDETKASRKDPTMTEGYQSNLQKFIRRAMLVTLFILLATVTVDTILVCYYCSIHPDHPAKDISTGRIFVLQLLYQNMMVPMSLRQALMTVCLWRKSSFMPMKCNSWDKQEVLMDVKVVCTDKTGTLTRNQMSLSTVGVWDKEGRMTARTNRSAEGVEKVFQPMWKDKISWKEKSPDATVVEEALFYLYVATSDESVSGPKKQPEEAAFLEAVPAQMTSNEKCPPGLVRTTPTGSEYRTGKMRYRMNESETHIDVVCSLGLSRDLLVKSEIVRATPSTRSILSASFANAHDEDFDYFVLCQSSEEFLLGDTGAKSNPLNKTRISQWNSSITSLAAPEGAPRIWFHSVKKMPKFSNELITKYHQASQIEDEATRTMEQNQVMNEILTIGEGPIVLSASYLVDKYRAGVKKEGIRELYEAGIPIAMITGDSSKAAMEIAKAIGMPESCNVSGDTEESLLDSVLELTKEKKPRTFIFDRNQTSLIQHAMVEKDKHVSWRDWAFGWISTSMSNPAERKRRIHLSLLAALSELLLQQHPDSTMRMHASVWARSLPHQKPVVVRFFEKICKLPSLFTGDGINDLMAIEKAAVSVGINGMETPVVSQTAGFSSGTDHPIHRVIYRRTDEWYPIVEMLLSKGPECSAMLATTVKIIWVKHALTSRSWSLETLALLHSFDSFIEPYASQLTMAYNAAIFFNIIAHVVSDNMDPHKARGLRAKRMYSMRSWTRWIVMGVVFGVLTTISLELVFPEVYGGIYDSDVTVPAQTYGSELSREQFGYRMASIHSLLLTTVLLFVNNRWQYVPVGSVLHYKVKEVMRQANTLYTQWSPKPEKARRKLIKLANLPRTGSVQLLKEYIEADSRILLHFTHTPLGRLTITLLFIRLLTWYGEVPIASTLVLASGICLLCWCFMWLVLHRSGPARFLFHPWSTFLRLKRIAYPKNGQKESGKNKVV
ncbi:hypothetical protein PROFUN_13404 [Planoprotostelium fungivorum]|uniref:P-type ATPase n=1 Tax=Planoprotostelium fungivorum TaxID=1890364 RepID=A0A2P6N3P7_9EUKA|nr:hypothetical protein PROFUN_13404 [Planoprotostelium fungivorum]